MLFEELTLSHVPLLKAAFSHCTSRICDQTLGGSVMWRKCFHTRFFQDEECIYLQSEYEPGKFAFTPPFGNFEVGVKRLAEYCKKSGKELAFCSVSDVEKEKIQAILPGFSAHPTRDWFDYLYLREKLMTLKGKKLSGQRNHMNYFLKTYSQWKFVPIGEENLILAKEFFHHYNRETEKDSHFFQEEKNAVLEVLDHLDIYGFVGGMILVGDQVVALSLGEQVGDTFFIHIEKADRAFRGAYQMILTQMLRYYTSEDVIYVNREEDVGDPGLRYSKEAYHPECLLAKYIMEIKENGN
jgi:hypothetical protein